MLKFKTTTQQRAVVAHFHALAGPVNLAQQQKDDGLLIYAKIFGNTILPTSGNVN